MPSRISVVAFQVVLLLTGVLILIWAMTPEVDTASGSNAVYVFALPQ